MGGSSQSPRTFRPLTYKHDKVPVDNFEVRSFEPLALIFYVQPVTSPRQSREKETAQRQRQRARGDRIHRVCVSS